jgi:hypothetical protein
MVDQQCAHLFNTKTNLPVEKSTGAKQQQRKSSAAVSEHPKSEKE